MGSASCFLQTPISEYVLALLALPFRPVTVGSYLFSACVMPGARESPSKAGGLPKGNYEISIPILNS